MGNRSNHRVAGKFCRRKVYDFVQISIVPFRGEYLVK